MLTIAISSELQCVFYMHTFIPISSFWRNHTPCYLQTIGFPLDGERGFPNYVWDPGRNLPPPHMDYTPSSFHCMCSCLHSFLTDPLFASQNKEFDSFVLFFYFFLPQKGSIHRVPKREEEGRVNGIGLRS